MFNLQVQGPADSLFANSLHRRRLGARVGAPLSFSDHQLAAGDSLFGLWARDAIDRAGRGGELLYIEELRTAERQAATTQRIDALTDAEIAEAHSSAEMRRDVECQVGPFDSFVSFMHALDWQDLPGANVAPFVGAGCA